MKDFLWFLLYSILMNILTLEWLKWHWLQMPVKRAHDSKPYMGYLGIECIIKGRIVGKGIQIVFPTAGITHEMGTTQRFTKAVAPTTIRNLGRRSKDELWSETSPVDRSGRTTLCSFLQWEMFPGRTTIIGILHTSGLNGKQRRHSCLWCISVKAHERNWHHETCNRLYGLMKPTLK